MFRYMAQDEMKAMVEDKWGEEVWGVEHPDPDSKNIIPKLVFYWGQDVCRTKFIQEVDVC
jgi:hypothetical protein